MERRRRVRYIRLFKNTVLSLLRTVGTRRYCGWVGLLMLNVPDVAGFDTIALGRGHYLNFPAALLGRLVGVPFSLYIE